MTTHIDITITPNTTSLADCNNLIHQIKQSYPHIEQATNAPLPIKIFDPDTTSYQTDHITIESAPIQMDIYGHLVDRDDASLIIRVLNAIKQYIITREQEGALPINEDIIPPQLCKGFSQ